MLLILASSIAWFYLYIRAKRRIRQGFINRVPYGIRGGGGDGDEPQVQAVPLSKNQQLQEQLFEEVQAPWTRNLYDLYKSVYEPQARELGGILGEELKQPLTLPEDVWSNIWQKGRERIVGEYAPIKQQASERFAGKGLLNQPITEKYFQQLDLSQAKSLEDLAVDMAIQEWTEKKTAKQQSIANMQSFLGMQPAFNISPVVPQYYTSMPEESEGYGGLGTGIGSVLGMGLGALLAPLTGGMSVPMGAMLGGMGGAGIGGGIGSLIK